MAAALRRSSWRAARARTRHSSGWQTLALLACVVLPTACHTPLAARKDAGSASDAGDADTPADRPSNGPTSPDLPADAPASPDAVSPDLARPDLATREVPAPDLPGLVPKAFRFANHTNSTAYVRVESPIGCRRQDGAGWQDCSFFFEWCMLACGNEPANGNCCVQCEQLLPSVYAIAPGASRVVPWKGSTYARATGACSQCECEMETPVQAGSFQASASVYADYECSPTPPYPCQATSDGIIDMANPRGGRTTVTVPFTVPYPGDEVVLDITSLPATDAGSALDAGAADTASVGDATTAVDNPPAQEIAACQLLPYSHFGSVTNVARCPVDPALPECASSDVGSTVYRDEACALATLKAHPDCTPWSRALDSEYVFLTDPFGGCGWPITLDSVLDCGDHVDIKYTVTEPCQTCDAVHPSSVMLIIRNDPKPVRATAALVRQEC
jgi:hypothetical protein